MMKQTLLRQLISNASYLLLRVGFKKGRIYTESFDGIKVSKTASLVGPLKMLRTSHREVFTADFLITYVLCSAVLYP